MLGVEESLYTVTSVTMGSFNESKNYYFLRTASQLNLLKNISVLLLVYSHYTAALSMLVQWPAGQNSLNLLAPEFYI